mmetsp:Transcript_27335/g.106918  ORF Transcript_27335/g.106918 Transcript_27335/m.106918 type:complete len:115 (+) Transcript_27335:2533-2877(+)
MNSGHIAIDVVANIRSEIPEIPIYVRAHDIENMKQLSNLGVVATYPETFETSLLLGQRVLRGYGIAAQDAKAIAKVVRRPSLSIGSSQVCASGTYGSFVFFPHQSFGTNGLARR